MIAALLATLACHTVGAPPMVAPDNACTPGAYRRLTLAQVCTSKDRPDLSTVERRAILANYGVPTWSGTTGEIDHRVPFYLGGTTDRRNLWPEPWAPGEYARRENAKDQLEKYTQRRVCGDHSMRPRTAVRMFLADWRHAWRRYIAP